jgi:hypothetical protein
MEEPTNHDFDEARLVTVDLAKSPSSANLGRISWGDVEVDDAFTAINGEIVGTTLGPSWPEFEIAGSAYLESSFFARLPARLQSAVPPMEGHSYEHASAVYWHGTADRRAGLRYAGHHARIIDERGSIAKLEVFAPGTSMRPNARTFTLWLDLSSHEQCDAGPQSLTTLGTGDRPKEGPIFLVSGKLTKQPGA